MQIFIWAYFRKVLGKNVLEVEREKLFFGDTCFILEGGLPKSLVQKACANSSPVHGRHSGKNR